MRYAHQITEMLVGVEASAELSAADVCRGRRGCGEDNGDEALPADKAGCLAN